MTLALAVGIAGGAHAETVTTTTGQKLTMSGDCGVVDGNGVSQGTATISAGSETIESVVVSINEHTVTVKPDGRGHFKASVPLPPRVGYISCSGTATASDGTKASTAVGMFIDYASGPRDAPTRSDPEPTPPLVHYGELPNTGPSGPRTLGPIGLAMVLLGSTLVWRNRRQTLGT